MSVCYWGSLQASDCLVIHQATVAVHHVRCTQPMEVGGTRRDASNEPRGVLNGQHRGHGPHAGMFFCCTGDLVQIPLYPEPDVPPPGNMPSSASYRLFSGRLILMYQTEQSLFSSMNIQLLHRKLNIFNRQERKSLTVRYLRSAVQGFTRRRAKTDSEQLSCHLLLAINEILKPTVSKVS